MWSIEVRNTDPELGPIHEWRPLGEGPFRTPAEAGIYAGSEVGIEWRVVECATPAGSRTVDSIGAQWRIMLRPEVLNMPDDCVVAQLVIPFLAVADALLAMTEESSERRAIMAACVKQVNVWYFG